MKKLIGVASVLTLSMAGTLCFGFGSGGVPGYMKKNLKANEISLPQGSTGQKIELMEGSANGTHKIILKAPDSLSADVVIDASQLTVAPDSLPAQAGQAGKFLKTDGSASSWSGFTNISTSGITKISTAVLGVGSTVVTPAADANDTQVANTGWTKAAITNAVASVASGVQILASDPAGPDPGEAWVNTTDSRFRVASAAGFYSYSGAFTAWDTTPDAFTFTDVTDATISTEYKASATLAGLNYATAVSIDGSGCQYSLNGENGTYTALSGTASNGAVWLKQTASSGPSTATTCTFTAGGISDEWSVTTVSSVDYTFYWAAESTTLDYPTGTMSAVGSPAGFISSDRSGATGNVSSTDGTQVNGHWATAITGHNIINPTSQGKIRMWVKAPTGSESANRYLIETVGQTGWFAVYIVANGRVEFDYGNGYALYGTGLCTSGTCENLVRGQWYNLEFSWSGNNIYIKNLTTGAYRTSTAPVPPSGTATSLSINGNQGTGYAQMDDIYIYNTAGTP